MAPRKKGPFSDHHIYPKQTEKSFAIYFIVKRISSDDATFENVSPFLVEKALSNVSEVANVRKLRTGDLLVEVASRQQSQKIMKYKNFGTISVSVSLHNLLNFSKGVITCVELLNETLDVIEKELKSQGVTHVCRITIRLDGKLLETKHHVLTSNSPKLPDSIKAGYMKLIVRPYVPNPLRCFKCQRFGHSKANCRGALTCALCAAAGHESNECSQKEKCVNCKGTELLKIHPSGEDDDDLQMSCEPPATLPIGADNSPPLIP
ncbi:uncharacterized protein LOC129966489 [Argiope bruennichi]|uniref:uncharacterized protein LOC129966489 n=1 Tax=Argiope bruennichi TaxID=94029 RepID=UPI00249503A2|nr:uncharacterized protein LOC129966489 [Argiope bruennichi]